MYVASNIIYDHVINVETNESVPVYLVADIANSIKYLYKIRLNFFDIPII